MTGAFKKKSDTVKKEYEVYLAHTCWQAKIFSVSGDKVFEIIFVSTEVSALYFNSSSLKARPYLYSLH